jgi:hypothetical protein
VTATAADVTYTVGGTAKGSGMVHPDMATVLCFMTTDAPVDEEWLAATLRGPEAPDQCPRCHAPKSVFTHETMQPGM